MNILETSQNLIEKVTDVVVTEALGLQQLVQIRLHEALDYVNILHGVDAGCSQDISDINHIFMVEPGQNLDFSQSSLTISLVLKWTYFLDGDLNCKINKNTLIRLLLL